MASSTKSAKREQIGKSNDYSSDDLSESEVEDVEIKYLPEPTGTRKSSRQRHPTSLVRNQFHREKKPSMICENYKSSWSIHEKNILLDLLYKHGDSNPKLLAASLPNKHVSQIKSYLRTISRRAVSAEKKRVESETIRKLNEWVKLFRKNYQNQTFNDLLPYELFKISNEFKSSDIRIVNDIVDFQKAYEYLYSLTIGRKIDVDERTHYFVHSYLDWFLTEFNTSVSCFESAMLLSGLKKLSGIGSGQLPKSPDQIFTLAVDKLVPQEQYLDFKYLLRHLFTKIKRSQFRSGEEYDRKIWLLRAQLDEDRDTDVCLLRKFCTKPDCQIIPVVNEFNFKNLASFVWAALFGLRLENKLRISP